MTDRPGMTQEEQAAIAAHAQRVSAYVQLKRLVAGWTAELALQDKADHAVARAIGALVALATVAAWCYLLWGIADIIAEPPSAIHAARLAFWYLAAIAALMPIFYMSFSHAIHGVLPRVEKVCLYGLPAAAILFVVGLLLAPLAVWLVGNH